MALLCAGYPSVKSVLFFIHVQSIVLAARKLVSRLVLQIVYVAPVKLGMSIVTTGSYIDQCCIMTYKQTNTIYLMKIELLVIYRLFH